jgi:hypothetical protein
MRTDHGSLLRTGARFWRLTKDGDPQGLALYERHYSCRKYRDGRKRRLFVGPGEKTVLLTRRGDALCVWRRFKSLDRQAGVNCAVFRNEGRVLSSKLLSEAMQFAWRRWPGERLYTYMNPLMIRSSNPGFCFKVAGWRRCGASKHGLLILEATP